MPYFEQRKIFSENKIAEKKSIDIEDKEDAQEFIKDEIRSGNLPIISVPKQYAEATQRGLRAYTTWIGEKYLVGTIGRDPYLPSGEERVFFRVHVESDQLRPRFTGPDKHFHGIVVFQSGQIPPNAIEEMRL